MVDRSLYKHIVTAISRDDIGKISITDIQQVLKKIKGIFKKDGTLLRLDTNDTFYIFGDIHGQYDDMSDILYDISRIEPRAKYVFLGDYIDRGTQSIQVILSLFAMKLKHPKSVYILRGNHECFDINKKYGFLNELQTVYGTEQGVKIHQAINAVFQYMPLAATICGRFFCVHGGISSKLKYISQIEQLKFPIDAHQPGTLQNDILWADPSQSNGGFGYAFNRGPTYGLKAVEAFLGNNGLEGIIRAHQCVDEGFETCLNDKVFTVFSAPNYCGGMNKASVVRVNHEEIRVLQFSKSDGVMRMEDLCYEGVP